MKYEIFNKEGVKVDECYNPFEAEEICGSYGEEYYYCEVEPGYASVY